MTNSLWTCVKCTNKYTPTSCSRICEACKNTNCQICTALLINKRSDAKFCDNCKPQQILLRSKNWYEHNKQAKYEYDKKRRSAKPELYREASRRYGKKNPDIKNAWTSARRKRVQLATPKWANLVAIKNIYLEAAMLSKETGICWHVDHMIPLRGELVCGLHVEDNLQIITAEDNLKKHNHYSLEHQGYK